VVVPLRTRRRAGTEDDVGVPDGRYDAIIVGSGHNGRIPVAYLTEPEVLPEQMFGDRPVA
jgi:hypothetical protein